MTTENVNQSAAPVEAPDGGRGSLADGSASGLREMGAKIIEAVMDGETRPLAIAALACEGLQFGDAVRIARGCLDYGGGYRGDTGKMEIFHHGIQTVINSLEAAQKRGLQDTQVAALHAMGKPNEKAQTRSP